MKLSKKELQKILHKESIITLTLYLIFFLWWYATAYLTERDPSKYSYILGFPKWFFLSCIVGYIGICILLWVCVKFFFTDIPFEDKEKHNNE